MVAKGLFVTIVTIATTVTIASAQVDPTGKWRTLETDHFRIHARAELHDVAVRAAGEAELAWAELSNALPAPHGRVDLIVADNVDDANGYAQTYPGNRVTIYAVPPAGDVELERYDRWLRLVITHELTHIFHLDLARGWWGVGRKVLGRAPFLFPNQYTPSWMREGTAVFYESRLTSAGRLDGAYHSAITRAESKEGGGLPMDAATTPSPIWPGGERFYAFGSTFIGWSAGQAGDSAIAHAISATSAQLIPYVALSPGWRAGTGLRLGPAWQQWQDSMAAAAAPDSAVVSEPLAELRLAVPPRLSRDGSRLLLAYNDGRDASRLVVLAADSAVRRLPAAFYRLTSVNGVAWTPDGNALVSQLEYQDFYNARSDLWSVSPAGSAKRLTNGGRLREPDMAPDSAIVAVRVVPGGRELVLRMPGGDWTVIGAAGDHVEWATPRFDQSGRLIAAVRVEYGWHDIQVYSRDGGTWRVVTRDSVADIQPSYSTDGRWLTWSREIDGVPQIVGVPANVSDGAPQLTQFTHEAFAAYAPAANATMLWYLAYHYNGFRLASRPLGGVPAGPLALQPQRTLPAPTAAVHGEHGYHALQTLLPQYWIPQLYLESGGAWFGALTSGTDAIGRHSYFASLLVGSGSVGGVWNGVLAYRYAGPGKLLIDAFGSHAPGLLSGGGCCTLNDDAGAGITWTRRRWYSSSAVRLGGEYSRDEKAQRVGGSVSASVASFETPALGISPQNGGRLSGSVRYRRRQDDGRSSVEYLLRGSVFAREGRTAFARAVFAIRAVGGISTGSDSTDFSVGGVSSGTFDVLPGLAIGGGGRTFSVRGFAGGSLTGRRAFAASAEQRLPLLLIGRGLGLFPLGLDRVSLSLFADGGATDVPVGHICPGDLVPPGPVPPTRPCGVLVSAGGEISLDLQVAYDSPLRLRIGAAAPIKTPSGVLTEPFYLSIGASF
jgi:hypothetical protein